MTGFQQLKLRAMCVSKWHHTVAHRSYEFRTFSHCGWTLLLPRVRLVGFLHRCLSEGLLPVSGFNHYDYHQKKMHGKVQRNVSAPNVP